MGQGGATVRISRISANTSLHGSVMVVVCVEGVGMIRLFLKPEELADALWSEVRVTDPSRIEVLGCGKEAK